MVFYPGNDIRNRDGVTLMAKVSTAFITSPCGVEGAVMSQDFKGNHFELVKDFNKDMKDFIIEIFAEVKPKMRESARRRDMIHGYAGVSSISSSPVLIM